MKIGDEVVNSIGQKAFVIIPDYKNTDYEGQMVVLVEGTAVPQIVVKDTYEPTGYNEPFIGEIILELIEHVGKFGSISEGWS